MKALFPTFAIFSSFQDYALKLSFLLKQNGQVKNGQSVAYRVTGYSYSCYKDCWAEQGLARKELGRLQLWN